jgi:hypothetical protein
MSMSRYFQQFLILVLVIHPYFSQAEVCDPAGPPIDLVARNAGILDRGPGRGASRELE